MFREFRDTATITAASIAAVAVWTSAAWAQATGSAESKAAARADPKWTPPVTAWGHPDLQGGYTSMVIDPADGRIPAATREGCTIGASRAA